MKDRYILKDELLPRDHPRDGGKQVWKIYDRMNKSYSMSYFTTKDAADKALERKNLRCS